MERLKKILASALLVCMLVSMLPVGALAEGEVCEHSATYVETVSPGCTTAGSNTTKCSACGITLGNETIPATGHNHQVTATTAPTCVAAGSAIYTCSACGDSYVMSIDATGIHTPGEAFVVTEATCTTEGSTAVACTVCSGVLSTGVIPALGHSYGEAVTKEATCTEAGVKTFSCSGCGDSYTETITAIGHSYEEAVTKEAACTETGVKTFTCKSCGDSYTEDIEAMGHSGGEASCEALAVCENCFQPYGDYGHKGGSADCEEKAVCELCGQPYGEPLGHDYVDHKCTRCEKREPLMTAAPPKSTVKVDNIIISGDAPIEVGESIKLTATVGPTDASNKNVVWSSSDTTVATISDTGVVTGLKEGSVTITATAADGQGAEGTATITVTPIKVKKINITGVEKINVGEKTTFSATVLPSAAGNKAVKWTSSDPTVATVDENTGEVTGVKKGNAVITATAQDGSNIKGSLQVYVIGSEAYEKAYIYAENHIVYVGETVKVHFVPPSDVKVITSASWSIAGASDGTGTIAGNLTEATVTGDSEGTLDVSVYVTGTKNDNKPYMGNVTSARLITVKAADEKPEPVPVTDIEVSGPAAVLAGKTITLTAAVTPEYADDTTVTWSTDNPEVATVDENGVVTGVKAGTVTVKATANDGSGVYATHSVTVEEIAVSVDGASAVLTGGTITLSAVVTPTYATDKTVTWESSDPTIATVDENGVVTGKKADKVTITATSNADPTKSASKEITVTAPSLTVSGPGTVTVGKTITLTAKVGPDEVKDKTVTWTSSDETIATVDKDGKVTGKKVGDVKITAASNAYENLTVEVPVKVTAAVYLYYGNGSHFNGIHPMPFVSSDLWAGGAGVSVVINGIPLVPGRDFNCYSSPSGMIGVTVNPGMLRLLPQNAWHTIDIISANGVASGYFSTGYFGYYNINGVRTGDDSNPMLWAALCLLGISGAGMILVKSRKRKA